ncbi:MAG: peroxiredoxin family protein, partial [Actinomycetes bacterium]
MASTKTRALGRGKGDGRRPGRRRRLWLAVGGIAVLAVLVVVASSRGGDAPTSTGSSEASSRIVLASAGGSAVGDVAPSFEVTTTAGTAFALPAGKPAVLFFMAGWCATCIPEATA